MSLCTKCRRRDRHALCDDACLTAIVAWYSEAGLEGDARGLPTVHTCTQRYPMEGDSNVAVWLVAADNLTKPLLELLDWLGVIPEVDA